MNQRKLSLIDQLICGLDRGIRTLSPNTQAHTRPCPQAECASTAMSDAERKHAAGLMRVNHAGEVCAQALYQGQALTAKLPEVRAEMENAAAEELDHLAWCEQRLRELNANPSILNPLWYTFSFGIGAAAGLVSDKLSLGFVAATEQQVCKHLESHLENLPQNDTQSKAIVGQMLIDEARHAHSALEAGGLTFSTPVKAGMTLVSKAMTASSYRI